MRLRKIHTFKTSQSSISKQVTIWSLVKWKLSAINKQSVTVATTAFARRQRLIKIELRRILVTVTRSILNESIAKDFKQQVEECVVEATVNMDVVLVYVFEISMEYFGEVNVMVRLCFGKVIGKVNSMARCNLLIDDVFQKLQRYFSSGHKTNSYYEMRIDKQGGCYRFFFVFI